MPKTKLRSHQGQVVPADSKIVDGFICPFTKQVFEEKKSYLNHLKKRRAHTLLHNHTLRFKNKAPELLQQTSFVDIMLWIERNAVTIFMESMKRKKYQYREKDFDRIMQSDLSNFYINVHMVRLRYIENCPNTHVAPRGKPTNWSRESDKPTGYPAWYGRIEYETPEQFPYLDSSIWSSLGIKTGTGSFGWRAGTEATLFLDDWIGLEKFTAAEVLKGNQLVYEFNEGLPF